MFLSESDSSGTSFQLPPRHLFRRRLGRFSMANCRYSITSVPAYISSCSLFVFPSISNGVQLPMTKNCVQPLQEGIPEAGKVLGVIRKAVVDVGSWDD